VSDRAVAELLFARGLLPDKEPTGEQPLFDIAVAEAKTERQPERVADDLRRQAKMLVRVGWRGCGHAVRMPHRAEAV
jgi:hypothetical protein